MARLFFSIATISLGFSLNAFAVGFNVGDEFTATHLSGALIVTCEERIGGGRRTVTVGCEDDRLTPSESARLVSDELINADKVELISTTSSGKKIRKSDGWEASRNRSHSQFKLWSRSIFKKPLLRDGENAIAFEFSKKGEIVAAGSFTATVKRSQARQCKNAWVESPNQDDCTNPKYVCADYFASQNYCQE